jgi:hypothetical protein
MRPDGLRVFAKIKKGKTGFDKVKKERPPKS